MLATVLRRLADALDALREAPPPTPTRRRAAVRQPGVSSSLDVEGSAELVRALREAGLTERALLEEERGMREQEG
jgi:hypothetical protein